METIAFSRRFPSADELWHGLLGGTVRISALIMGQPEERCGDGLELPVAVKLAAGRKRE